MHPRPSLVAAVALAAASAAPALAQTEISWWHAMTGANSRGVRLVNLPQVRDIENEEFEKMLAGEQTTQAALDNAVRRADEAISQALGN
jgi:ABC-type glycerol-3-phosphate transport system substrate-binding protein